VSSISVGKGNGPVSLERLKENPSSMKLLIKEKACSGLQRVLVAGAAALLSWPNLGACELLLRIYDRLNLLCLLQRCAF
jgi:hypothetical protein